MASLCATNARAQHVVVALAAVVERQAEGEAAVEDGVDADSSQLERCVLIKCLCGSIVERIVDEG